jgi:predicted Zn-dependent protease
LRESEGEEVQMVYPLTNSMVADDAAFSRAMATIQHFVLIAGSLAFLALTGCQGIDGHLEWMLSGEKMQALAGSEIAAELEARKGGVVRNDVAEARMYRVGRYLAEASPAIRRTYAFQLLNSDDLNALSLPCGRIYLTRELYVRLETEDQLAAVLAHEMGHIHARDHYRPASTKPAEVLDRELKADARALSYLRSAGYSPLAMITINRLTEKSQPRNWAGIRCSHLRDTLAEELRRKGIFVGLFDW